VQNADRRIKVLVYITASSGIRIGAWEYLQWQHVIPITNGEYLNWIRQQQELNYNNKNDIHSHLQQQQQQQDDNNDDDDHEHPERIIAAKLIVYAGEPEEYFTFITPEAYHALKEWMDFRASYAGHLADHQRKTWR
jgi:hypothetical protein